MISIVCLDRTAEPGALWSSKAAGNFSEGDPMVTRFSVQGRVEVKELGGHLKAFFQAIILKPRLEMKQKPEEKKENDSDSSDDSSTDSAKNKTKEVDEPIVVPKLHAYLTVKRPKKRMIDAHKLGTRIFLSQHPEGHFGELDVQNDYEASLADIMDLSGFQGLVVLKLPIDEPVTDEPIIYGYVRFVSNRALKIRSLDALKLTELYDLANKLIIKEKTGNNGIRKLGPESRKLVKSLKVYASLANKAWTELLQKEPDDTITFNELVKILDKLDMFLLKTQAKRLFDAIDKQKTGKLSVIDLENLFIAKDLMGQLSHEIILLDVFDALKSKPMISKTNEIIDEAEHEEDKAKEKKNKDKDKNKEDSLAGVDYAAFQEVIEILGYKPPSKNALDGNGSKNIQGLKAVPKLATVKEDKPEGDDKISKESAGVNMKYNQYTRDEELENYIRKAFCSGGGVREKDADHKYLTLAELRKAWLSICDVQVEMNKRSLKPEQGLFSDNRNKERLGRFLVESEGGYVDNVSRVFDYIIDLKAGVRQRRDERKREREAMKEKLFHDANKFIALRGQEKRLALKKEQEEKAKKRVDEKVLRNKLLVQQQEILEKQRKEIKKANAEKEKLKLKEVRALGLDLIDLSLQKLREVPSHVYKGPAAQTKLGYAVLLDFSRNMIERLPDEDALFYWLAEARKLKLSENRLRRLPVDFTEMAKLEILEIDKNRLEELPITLGKLSNLQKLMLANNKLTSLPESIGGCGYLKHLSVHSNQLTALPVSLGLLYKLEYFDASRNMLRELPEDLENLVSLLHLDLSSNQLQYVFHNVGNLTQLHYLDLSTNTLTSMPTSFHSLTKLEYVNLENNAFINMMQCFEQLSALKYLNLRKNNMSILSSDIGNCRSLTFIDLSLNTLQSLPQEIGLLSDLLELRLGYNSLSELPPELGGCLSLARLTLDHNRIEGCLPPSTALIRCLKELDLSHNYIDSLPESIVGLQELEVLKAQDCQLRILPQSIVHIHTLHTILVGSNRFISFPIHLSQLSSSLRVLDLTSNSISLLPRNINTMTFLDSLSLRNNQLQALPVEFVELLESIPSLDMTNNPWTLLPPKWGLRYDEQTSSQREGGLDAQNSKGFGYSLPQVLDFLYAVSVFYETAEQVWAQAGVFYYSNRLGLHDFILELKRRLPNGWHDGLLKYAEFVYFKSKELGSYVRWYEIDSDALEREKEYANRDVQRKDSNIVRSRQDTAFRQQQAHRIYHEDIPRRMDQAALLLEESRSNNAFIETVQLKALHEMVVARAVENEKKYQARQEEKKKLQRQEMNRLKEILMQDAPVRELERQTREKRKAKEREMSRMEARARLGIGEDDDVL